MKIRMRHRPILLKMNGSHQAGLGLADWLVGQALAAMVVLAALALVVSSTSKE